MNNSSMFTADRMTHLKIVVVALVCATMVAGIGIAARVTDGTDDGQWAASHRDQGDRAGHGCDDRQQYGSLIRFWNPKVFRPAPTHSGVGLIHSGRLASGVAIRRTARASAAVPLSGPAGRRCVVVRLSTRIGPQLRRQPLGEEPPGADQSGQRDRDQGHRQASPPSSRDRRVWRPAPPPRPACRACSSAPAARSRAGRDPERGCAARLPAPARLAPPSLPPRRGSARR